jgi:hypothetical protein
MKTLFSILLTALLFTSCKEVNEYRVKLKFCNGQKDTTITVYSTRKPASSDIDTYNQALPNVSFWMTKERYCNCTMSKFMNVCDLTVIE